jgi:uridine kinase
LSSAGESIPQSGLLAGLAALMGTSASARPITVLIDGPSGAGKSTFADWMVAVWPIRARPTLVRMDDIYPGWSGLDDAISMLRDELLRPRSEGGSARWRRYDWRGARPAEWHAVDPRNPLIVEGCGTLSRENARLADLRIWLDAPTDVRKERALARDSGGFDAHWDQWQRDYDEFAAREHPQSSADVLIDGTDWPSSADTVWVHRV